MTLEQLHTLFLKHPTVCTDTRKITKGCIFFALKGPKFNGNTFADEAIKNGAEYVVIDEEKYKKSDKHLLFSDVLETLQKLSTFHRNHSSAKVISLTGSNGKTTTKELINVVLSKKYRTIATQGNLNNHIGVPLTLLSIKPDTEIAIVEMGANHQREIAFLSSIAQPDFGYITNFGKAHLEGFGGVEGVIKGKSELYDYLILNNKYVFLNADDSIQKRKLELYTKKIGFSIEDHQYYIIKFLGANPFVIIEFENEKVETQLIGKYNFSNCCAAILMGKYFNVSIEDIKNAIESYRPQNNRSQIIDKKDLRIILDAYNANPSSMKVALENFEIVDAPKKYLFLGDMFELGKDAEKEHQAIVDYIKELGFTDVYLIGENFSKTQTLFKKFNSFEDLKKNINTTSLDRGNVLIKGSRGMALERILEFL
ncbi:UDP-N-acetylmuramoyl-tripeptide--D-alanyl-D-alanine ligase [Flagellimonas maritima]|uniref:UDP-N-acetylmuramoyl-tripeptide--D-alanyl-D-alanine ligase n=1 Tax=Flagellimonas maritima TaxID=1383885 RepID=A0A2Z4LPY7_9FLAO|nr:UDP-N-acetylmuramoyl-tripeptide--D-alanyl-D-alanine ligase [Allomuricauda aurantiaca]AWX43876.1 UDP-N-acetylmuramoyl-tripeptide--D-alanyl-D-alanine ligase [Allomuricauda aurantiaca]